MIRHVTTKPRNDTVTRLRSPEHRASQHSLSSKSTPSSLPVLRSSSYKQDGVPISIFSGPSAFLGPTSFSAVFHDYRDSLERSHDLSTSEEVAISGPLQESDSSEASISPDLLNTGIKVLEQIPSEVACGVLFSRTINPNDGWVRLAGEWLSSSIWTDFGPILTRKSLQEINNLTRMIFRNTNSKLHEEDNPSQWFASISGRNLRWEILGILFTYWSLGALASADGDPIFASASRRRKGRRELMIELKECATSCIAFCSHADYGNLLLVYLLYKHSLLESMISGDASLIYWRQHADLCSMATALGMHRDTNQAPGKVSLSSEMRRRIYAAVFNIDKVTSTFTGRPPMLSYRYSSTPLPLDLSDEQLLSDPASLADSVDKLDPNGWSMDGRIYSTTILRARTSFAIVRGEILDVAFCSVPEDIWGRLLLLKQRSNLLYEQLPRAILCTTDDLSDHSISSPDLYSRLVTRLEHLQNLFLMERLLIRTGHATAQEIIDVSREMLRLTSGFWKERDRLVGLRGDFEWLIMYHAVPAAGILCVELLKQSKDPAYALAIPRSESIQDLIMFSGFLDWVQPGAPNFDLCRRIREIVQRVLEQVLESLPSLSAERAASPAAASQAPLDLAFDTDLRDFDDYATFDLLDTFDWSNESWIAQT